MRLLIRRSQRSAILGGKPVFSIEVRAQLSRAERAHIDKYKLGNTLLYESHTVAGGSGLLGLASRAAYNVIRLSLTVNDLRGGKRIECKDVAEMIGIEAHIRETTQEFKMILEAAVTFGGERVLEL